ncbi:MAG: non-ribosomal peptide synthetase, partial [Fuerstiella sp.]|nr:non-ribosomal peptide synthetase [Fuerstiella sp.]
DLNTGPLLRVQLIATADNEHVLLVMIHHIIADAWSIKVLMQDLIDLYAAHRSDRVAELAALTVQYPDYSVWQRDWLAGEELERQVRFWRERLAGAPAVLEMPTDRPRPPVQTFNGAHAWWRLSSETTVALRELANREGCTLFMVLISAYALLLGRYSRQDDLLVGTPIAGRQHTELENLIGFFVNTLVLRADFSGQPTFREYLQRIKRESLDAFSHQDLPFEKLVEELQPERDTSRSPLFQAAFILQNTPNEAAGSFADLQAENVFVEHSNTKFDLTLGVWEDAEGIGGSLEYNTDLFDASTIERLLEHLTMLLEGIVANPAAHVGELPMLNDAERQHLLTDLNATELEYPLDGTMHGLFEQQAAVQPDA